MDLTNEFEVAVPVERAWAVLTDLERIAPCLPGAQLREVEGDEYRGAVKIKVGPITTSYDGAIRITELDELGHRAVMKAEGRETRGQGNVSAVITATMSPSGTGTKVTVATDLSITGKVAQFGRGVLADVSAKLLDQFVVNLESSVLTKDVAGSTEGAGPVAHTATDAAATASQTVPVPEAGEAEGGPVASAGDSEDATTAAVGAKPDGATGPESRIRHIDSAPAEPVDLLDVAGGSVVRRLVKPLAVIGVVAAVVLRANRRRRK